MLQRHARIYRVEETEHEGAVGFMLLRTSWHRSQSGRQGGAKYFVRYDVECGTEHRPACFVTPTATGLMQSSAKHDAKPHVKLHV